MNERTAIILAGGKGVRIGRTVKAFLRLSDKTLIERVVESVQPLVDQMVVVIGRDSPEETFRKMLPERTEIYIDEGEREGALVGLLTGLRKAKFEYSLVLPCDSPFVNREVVKLLFSEATGMDAAIPLWPNGFIEPLHAVYKTKPSQKNAEKALKEGNRIRDMINLLRKVRYIPIEKIREIDRELLSFYNINTRRDLEKAAEVYSKLSVV